MAFATPIGITYLHFSQSPSRHSLFAPPFSTFHTVSSTFSISPIAPVGIFHTRDLRVFNSLELEHILTTVDHDEMSDYFFEAIEELESMTRDPSDILQQLNHRLSPRELQLVLVYFSQDGRDSWCALEVFEWLKKENRIDQETLELMVSIMCEWLKKMILSDNHVGEVVDLLVDMDCAGLTPSFSMMEKAISVYWDSGKKDDAVSFVKEVLRRGLVCLAGDGDEGHKGGPTGYLAWKMMEEGNYRDAVKLVIHLKETGLNPETYSCLIAMTAVVKELNEVAKAFNKLKGFARDGLVEEMEYENIRLVEKYQSEVLKEGIRLSSWLLQEENTSILTLVHEKLLAMYICAGHGLEAEQQLWEMKLIGKHVERYFYDIVLAICASQSQTESVSRLLTIMDATSSTCRTKTLSWLIRGYIKGGNYKAAAATLTKVLDLGLNPDRVDRAAVLQGLRSRLGEPGYLEIYLRLCKCLADAELIGPCLVYMYVKRYGLWIVKMI